MKKTILSAIMAVMAVLACAQDKQPVTYVGETESVVEIRGSQWIHDWTSIGWSVGSYSDDPANVLNSIYLYNCSFKKNMQIQPGSKLILKVNGEPMVLTTAQGTYFNGATSEVMHWSNTLQSNVACTQTIAYYELTQEQVDLINTHGISKYRFQIDSDVYERDDMNSAKIAKKMKKAYERLQAKQQKKQQKINDLSDF